MSTGKRLRISLAVSLVLLAGASSTHAQYSGGTGEADDPYQIATATDLISLGERPGDYRRHFILTTDIDLDPALPGGQVFDRAVIAPSAVAAAHVPRLVCDPFEGRFDGNGHTIRNLVIQAEGEWAGYIGLFGCIEGDVRALRLENVSISGVLWVGGLTGYNQGTIARCAVSGTIIGETRVGAVAGTNEGVINSCYAEGDVFATDHVGGLVGNHLAGTIAFSYALAQVTGEMAVGGLVGASEEGAVYLSFWDVDSSGVTVSAGGRGKHAVEMMDRATYRGWGYPGVWTLDEGRDYPRLLCEAPDGKPLLDAPCLYGGGTGEPNDPYQIWSTEHLISIGYCPEDFNDCFMIMADIDLGAADPNEIVPIGTDRWPFGGQFDGNGYAIANLSCTLEGQSGVGLFGCVRDQRERSFYKSSIIKNVHLVDALVTGGSRTGSLAGRNEGHIEDCQSMGVVHGSDHVGGLIGYNRGTVSNCYHEGSVEGKAHVGGLCGSHNDIAYRAGRVESSGASGSVTGLEKVGGLIGASWSHVVSCQANSNVSGVDEVGGLVGYNGGHVDQSYATSNVQGQTEVGGLAGANSRSIQACTCSGLVSGRTEVGGLVGYNSNTITSCYSTASISGDNSVGGLVGLASDGTMTYCYAAGPVVAEGNDVGGLVGSNRFRSAFFQCYWDIEATGIATSRGGYGRSTGLMMKADTFQGWAGTGLWTILEDADYPRLVWEQRPGEPITNASSPYGGGTGTANDPYEIWTAEQFVEIAYHPDHFGKSFALMADLDLATLDVNETLPIGSEAIPFMGVFDGHGHTIANFRCVCPRSPCTGLFGFVGWTGLLWEKPAGVVGQVRNLRLAGVYVSGGSPTGGLAGASNGHISSVSVTGNVEGDGSVGGLVGLNQGSLSASSASVNVFGRSSVGGLVGSIPYPGTQYEITECHAEGTVSGSEHIGGLIGYNYDTIVDCSSDCAVTGMTSVGGLIGRNRGELSFCHATGQVSGDYSLGGLVGFHEANLRRCYATGAVTADGNNVGGLVGTYWGASHEIRSSYATGDVQGHNRCGGLVGYSWVSPIRQSYSLSRVSGHDAVGGLVGKAGGEVESSYAQGDIRGNDFVGGLIGVSTKPVPNCYAAGAVSGNTHVGGFFGRCWYRQVESSFWDITTSEQTLGNGYDPHDLEGLTGLFTAQMQTQQTYREAGWDFLGETANGTEDIWWIDEDRDYPRLWWEEGEQP